jgi:hypothetical protein
MPTDLPTPDTTPIHRLIRRTRRWLRSSWVATGASLAVGLLTAALVIVGLTDLAVPLWPAFRLLALVLVVVPAATALVFGVGRPLLRRLGAGQVARRIEAHVPNMHNRLVSCVEIDSAQARQTRSPAFFRRLVGEVLDRLRGFRPSAVVDWLQLRRAGLLAGVGTAALVLAWLLFADRLNVALARVFAPFADIPPASGVEYTVAPGNATALRGDDIVFRARVTAGKPDQLRLEIRPDGGETLWHDLTKTDDATWQITLTGLEQSFAYRVHGGGTWSKEFRLTLLERPAITGLQTVLHFPDYMGLPEPRVGPPQTAEVTGPEGSTVEVAVDTAGDVAEGRIEWLKARTQRIKAATRPERPWFAGQPPAAAPIEGKWLHDEKDPQAPAVAGLHERRFRDAPVPFQVQAGEALFLYAYLPPDRLPEALMIQWQDAQGWEHRAVWGADKLPLGTAGTSGRRLMGPLPPAGKWVRLEVPAAAVGLEGQGLRGLGVVLFGGQAFTGTAGALAPADVDQTVWEPVRAFPMEAVSAGRWAGRFPLDRSGHYRVTLVNPRGDANKPMKEAAFTALPDQPPQVLLERPAGDLALGEPGKVPLVIAAYDDYGLASVAVAVQKGDAGGFATRPIKKYPKPLRSDNVVGDLDLTKMDLKAGEHVRYRVEARDRKGQVAQTKEYVIRIVGKGAGAEAELDKFRKSQDPFQENLAKLLTQQAKVREAVTKMEAQYKPLSEKVQAAKAAAEAKPKPEGAPQVPEPPPQLDPASQQQLDALRKELAELAKQEQQNADLAKQMGGDLNRIADEAAKQALLPPQVAQELAATRDLFNQLAAQPLQKLAGEMARGGQPQGQAPDLPDMKGQADKLQKDLEAMKQRMEALRRAEDGLKDDARAALDRLRQDLLRQNGGMTARDLEELRKFLAALRGELQRLEAKQDQLMRNQGPVPDREKQQDAFEKKEADPKLDAAKQLQDAERARRLRRKPEFPDQPYTPEGKDQNTPPKEEDTPEPAKDAQANPKDGIKADGDRKPEEEGEEKFMPALGGPKPKTDPRYANKVRPVDKPANTEQGRREQLEARQGEKLNDLNAAQQSLQVDEQTVQQMLRNLQQALEQNGRQGQPQGEQPGQPSPQELAQMLQSPELRQAMEMAARMRQLQAGQQGQRGQQPQGGPSAQGNQQGARPPGSLDVEMAKLDPATRTVLLKMQPKLREELLQGMREAGPEGYQKFIDDYFKRLTEVKK